MGWYYYLDDKIQFPFQARCIKTKRISPLKPGEVVKVTRMAPEEECLREMFIEIEWHGRTLGAPLAQLEGVNADEGTRGAIADWHYWVARGHEF